MKRDQNELLDGIKAFSQKVDMKNRELKKNKTNYKIAEGRLS